MNEDFLISIILRARDEASQVLGKAREELRGLREESKGLGGDVDVLDGEFDSLGEAVADVGKQASNTRDKLKGLRGDFKEFSRDMREGKADRDDVALGYKKIGEELDKLQKKQKIGSGLSKEVNDLNLEVKRAHRDLLEGDRSFNQERDKIAREAGISAKSFAAEVNADLVAGEKKAQDERLANLKAQGIKDYNQRKAMADLTADLLKTVREDHERQNKAIQDIDKETTRVAVNQVQQRATMLEAAAAREARGPGRRETLQAGGGDLLRGFGEFRDAIQRQGADLNEARSQLRRYAQDLDDVGRTYQTGSQQARLFGGAAEEARTHMRNLGRENVEVERSSGGVISRIESMAQGFQTAGVHVRSLGSEMRGMLILGVIGFFQQLATAAMALGANLVALASSAAFAGAALGGALAAGAAQAIPAFGLLIAAFQQVGGVMDALKQRQNAQQQAATQQAQGADKQRNSVERLANAHDAVVNAQDRLAESTRGISDAQRRVGEAQEGVRRAQERLNEARKDGRRELEDLINAEREAELAARGAALSQEEAQRALRAAIQGGDQLRIAQARLRVDEAAQADRTARQQVERTRADNREGQAGGIEGLDSVRGAREGVASAQRSVEQASRGVADARRNAEQAARALAQARRGMQEAAKDANDASTATVTAQRNLDFLLSKMSRSERALYEALISLQDNYKRLVRPITDIIIDSFTRTVERVERIMSDPRILGTLGNNARAIAGAIDRIGQRLASSDIVGQMARIGNQGARNIKPLTDILVNIGEIFLDIAEAAGPSLRKIILWVRDITDNWSDFIENSRQSGTLGKFFADGVTHLKAWVDLLGAIGGLFFAIAGEGGGAASGLRIIRRITEGINGWTEAVRDNSGRVNKFFRDSEGVLGDIWRVLKEIGIAVFESFDPESVTKLANILVEIVVPAITGIIRGLGRLVEVFEGIASIPGMNTLMIFMGQAIVFWKTITLLSGAVGNTIFQFLAMGKAVSSVALAARGAAAAMAALRAGQGIGAAITAWEIYSKRINAAKIATNELTAAQRAQQLLGGAPGPLAGRTAGGGIAGAFGRGGALRGIGVGLGVGALATGGVVAGQAIGGPGGSALSGAATGAGLGAMLGPLGALAGAGIGGAIGLGLGLKNKAADDQKKQLEGYNKELDKLVKRNDVGGLDKFRDKMEKLADEARKFGDEKLAKSFEDAGNKAQDAADKVRPFARFTDSISKNLLNPDDVRESGGNAVAQFLSNLNRMRTASFTGIRDIRDNMKFNLDQINKGFEEGSASWQTSIARNFGAGIDAIKKGMADGTISATRGMKEINRVTREQMRFVRDNADTLSQEAKERLATNFRNARLAIEAQTGGWEKATGKALENIRKLMAKELELYGMTPEQARRLARNRTTKGREDVNQFGQNEGTAGGGKAIGGWLGNRGERGEDGTAGTLGGHPVGRGEAVLHYAHQNYVEPAMQYYYGHGLDRMFDRVKGEHSWRSPGGYAAGKRGGGGGFIGGVMGSGEGFQVLMRYLGSIFGPIKVISGSRPGSIIAGSNRLSNHSGGNAVDISAPGLEGATQARPPETLNAEAAARMDKLFPYIQKNIKPKIGLDLLWRTLTGGNHYNHIHMGIKPAWGHDAARMEAFVRSLPGGGSIGGGGGFGASIPRQNLPGANSRFRDIAQLGVDSVRGAANEVLKAAAAQAGVGGADLGSVALGPGGAAQKVFDYFVKRGLTPAQAAGVAGTLQKESNFSTTVLNKAGSGATGLAQWLGGRLAALKKKENWESLQTQLDFIWEELTGPEGRALGALRRTRSPEEAARIFDRLYERSDGLLSAPANARKIFEQFGGSFAKGGVLPFARGKAGIFEGHGGEWVVNEQQQGRLASLTGLNPNSLKQALGFHGGPHSFEGGGELPFQTRDRLKDIRKGDYALPPLDVLDPAGVVTEINRLNRAIGNIKRKSKESFAAFNKRILSQLDFLTRDGGLFDQMNAALEREADVRSLRLLQGQFRRGRGRNSSIVRLVRDERRQEELEAREALRTENELRDFRKAVAEALAAAPRALRRITARINRLRAGGVDKDEKKEVDALLEQRKETQGTVRANRNRLRETDRKIAESVQSRYEKQIEAINNEVGRIDQRAGRAGAGIDRRERIANLVGDTSQGAQFANERAQIARVQAQQLAVQQQRAARRGNKQLAAELGERIADLNASIEELAIQAIQATVADIEARGQRAQGNIDRGTRLGQLLGRDDMVNAGAQATVQNIQNQMVELQAQANNAWATLRPGLAMQIEDKIRGLMADQQIVIIESFQAQVGQINERYQRAFGRADIAEKAVGFGLGGIANFLGFGASRQAIFNQRDQLLRGQANELSAARGTALALGDMKTFNELTDKIAELNVAIAENTQAAREFRISLINQRASFITGTAESGRGLIASIAALQQGDPNAGLLTRLFGTSLNALETQRGGLRGELASLLGINPGTIPSLSTQGDVVQFIDRITPLINNLPEALKSTGQDLVSTLLQNATATADLTKQMRDLNGQMNTQTFSTSAWQAFRVATFNGAGGLLPQGPFTTTPTMAPTVGGTGVARANTGYGVRDVNVHLSNPTQVADPTWIGQRVAWEIAGSGRK